MKITVTHDEGGGEFVLGEFTLDINYYSHLLNGGAITGWFGGLTRLHGGKGWAFTEGMFRKMNIRSDAADAFAFAIHAADKHPKKEIKSVRVNFAGEITEDKKPDMVNHPPHYNQGAVECIDALRAAIGDEAFKGHCTATAIKYLWRWQQKGGTQDLEKSIWYINKIIEMSNAVNRN